MDDELDRFKQLDPRPIMASFGFAIDKRESSRNSTVMRCGHDKIIVSRKPDGHYTYWSPRDDEDRGTVIDFIARRKGLNLGQVRRVIRDWSGSPASVTPPTLPPLVSVAKDREAVQARFAAMKSGLRHPYLERERAIPALALHYWRFAGRIKTDRHANACFAHMDEQGLCGYEIRGPQFKGFSAGGKKALFASKQRQDDARLVVCESAIEVLSYSVLMPDGHARYISLGGKPSPAQRVLLEAQIMQMPAASEIVAAMNGDAAGRDLAEIVRSSIKRSDVTFRSHEPVGGFKDWNLQLQSEAARHPVLLRARMPESGPA